MLYSSVIQYNIAFYDTLLIKTLLILYNHAVHCRSICGYVDPCELIPTKDTESDITLTTY